MDSIRLTIKFISVDVIVMIVQSQILPGIGTRVLLSEETLDKARAKYREGLAKDFVSGSAMKGSKNWNDMLDELVNGRMASTDNYIVDHTVDLIDQSIILTLSGWSSMCGRTETIILKGEK